MKNRVLFVTEKWVDGHPSGGLTNNFHNLFNTFRQCKPEYQFNTLHIDESSIVYGKHIDDVLPFYCLHNDVNIIFFCLLGDSPMNPSMSTYDALKSMGIMLCFIWPDTGRGWAIDTMKSLESVATQHVSWDRPVSEYHSTVQWPKNYLSLWAPQDASLYQWNELDFRPNSIGFYGRRFGQRISDIAYLSSKIPDFVVSGGQREQGLTPEQYAQKIRNTQIVVNFPYHALGFSQVKSRVLETMACSSLLFELSNPSTSQLFEPDKDYVECKSLDDMVAKFKFYQSNPTEMARIARNGHAKYRQNYTAAHYWEKVFDHLSI